MSNARELAELSGSYGTGGFVGMKNRIINGAMGISQRGTSFSTPASGSYTLDRFAIAWSGAAPASVAQVAGPTGFKNALQITGAASNTAAYVIHRIESNNCSDLSGVTVTIQANIAVSSAQTIGWNLLYANSQDNFSGVTLISSGTWSATTTATTFTATITGLPAGSVNGLSLFIGANNFGAFTSGTVTITGVQLEKGSTATSFDYRPYGTELALCQRYYQYGGMQRAYSANTGGQYAGQYYKFQVVPRAAPAVTVSAGGVTNRIQLSDAPTYTTSYQVADISSNGFLLVCTAGLSTGQYVGGDWIATAEL